MKYSSTCDQTLPSGSRANEKKRSNKQKKPVKQSNTELIETQNKLSKTILQNEQLIRDNQILHTMLNKLKVDIRKYKDNYKSMEIMIKKLKQRTFELESKPDTPEEIFEEEKANIQQQIDNNEARINKIKKKKKIKRVPTYERLYKLGVNSQKAKKKAII